MDLFSNNRNTTMHEPLASRIRPDSLDNFIGQKHLLNEDKLLYQLIKKDRFSAIIFCGKPGVGKTTLSQIIAQNTNAKFIGKSSLSTSVKDVKSIIEQAKKRKELHNQETILFLDEFHRFSKSQQDSLLTSIEDGTLRFIGATTYNPSFAIISAILSRSQVFYLEKLTEEELKELITKTLTHPKAFPNKKISISQGALDFIIKKLDDTRHILTLLENLVLMQEEKEFCIKLSLVENVLIDKKSIGYGLEEHYDTISAYIKSMRDNCVDEALFWLATMLKKGEDILFIARRLIIFAAEDIGNADPRALILTQTTFESCHKIGMPEAQIILAQATTYCATAPKSRASYDAINLAIKDMDKKHTPSKERTNKQSLSKRSIKGESKIFPVYYNPKGLGYEKIIKERLEFWRGR